MINLPDGTYNLFATYLGYKPETTEVTIKKGETREINFVLEEDALGLEEIVVTGDRNATNRIESSTIVNTLTPKLLPQLNL